MLRLGNSCADCGARNLPIDIYAFHHHSEKMTDHEYIQPGRVIAVNNPELLEREIPKWTMLCLNCHGLRHGSSLTAEEITRC